MDLSDFLALEPALSSVGVEHLSGLGLATAPRQRLGEGSFSYTADLPDLDACRTVTVRQARVRKTRVEAYVKIIQAGGKVPAVALTDRPQDGTLWHLDGLHRLVAYRLLGLPCPATLWR